MLCHLNLLAKRIGACALVGGIFLCPAALFAEDDASSVTIFEGETGYQSSTTTEGDLGTINTDVNAGANIGVDVSDSGVDVNLEASLHAQLEAISESVGIGDENLGASASLEGAVEALIGAEATIGAHFDENGITIGAEGTAGAFVSAEGAVNFEAHVFGVEANVTATVAGHAGALATGEASVHIGTDGKVTFTSELGLALGLGGSAGVQFSVDASELIANHPDIDNMEDLINWIAEVVENPEILIDEIKDHAEDMLTEVLEEVGNQVLEGISDMLGLPNDSLPSGGVDSEVGLPSSSPAAPASATGGGILPQFR